MSGVRIAQAYEQRRRGSTIVSNFQTPRGQLGVWRFETRSTLHKKVEKIQNALSKIS